MSSACKELNCRFSTTLRHYSEWPGTAHGGQQSAVDAVGDQPWLDINNTYSYVGELFRLLRRDYERKPVRPFVLIESTYENEHNARPEQIRRQAYWAMTSHAADTSANWRRIEIAAVCPTAAS